MLGLSTGHGANADQKLPCLLIAFINAPLSHAPLPLLFPLLLFLCVHSVTPSSPRTPRVMLYSLSPLHKRRHPRNIKRNDGLLYTIGGSPPFLFLISYSS